MTEDMGDSIVSIRQVTKVYSPNLGGKPKIALSDVNLEILQGESVGFIGHNGAGKSTTIRLILGLQRPTSGRVLLRGLDVDDPNSRVGVSYLPENPLLYDYLTPLEMLEMGAQMHRISVCNLRKHCMEWLDKLGVAGAAFRPIRTLSKGMAQRTALAHALCSHPQFLILDEPLSGLDPIGRSEVVQILDAFRKQGNTLFFSSHVLTDVERLADRFVFLFNGHIKAIGSPDDLLSDGHAGFEIVVEGSVAPDGFYQISPRFFRCVVLEECLVEKIALIVQGEGARIYSVKRTNSLEMAYLKYVSEASPV